MPLNPEVIQVLLPSREFYPLTRSDRTGEVLFALRRSDGRIWLQTKHSYPEGIFRIPGGGVNIGEDPHEAVFREIAEETGFHASRPILLDRFAYTGPDGSEIHWFSDLYLADIGDHEPVPEDTTEGISGWHAADPTTEITRHIRLLEGLQGPQHPWGIFRAAALVRLRERANGLRLP
jgi:8-oxo-dGTP pyrophosphatase MutT (NUDIX family)